ncbi:MAG TPA: AraC family transcriptional regulator [Candidatus Eisenbergiella merdavium]|uniref:AraC family transcriptional regulator n=2 Tax=Eisenbergiella TaxID=1432051 RepID=A0A9D2MU11_9FIRM|nr:AraC family transcriptional regulator [Candidatus Eisenbergiella merdigallinarum]HJC22315.1 AraC family transcriptional regulator [Candidatus Eisenbergiella merdavium]
MKEGKSPFYEKADRYLHVGISENMVFPVHLHEEAEILYCLEGSLQVTVMDQTKEVEAGGCALIFPGQIHGYLTKEHSRSLMMIFSPAAAGSYGRMLQKSCPEAPFVKKEEIPRDARIALECLCELPVRENGELRAAWLMVLLASLLPGLPMRENTGPESTDLTWRLIQYIGEHFQEPLSLEGLARELHVNKFYLSHTFSRKLQMNFREYLNHIRLDHARRLIRSTSRPMTEIWAEAGFESQRSFNRVFREVEGMTPGQYRKAPDGR